ncbi:hypothetical protein C8046_08120 [Serinibacter arcticus]|uniref:Uncharacterized protein n=1 Tax=Serinibacter arcticus TaxID=1655435 RepID=A0A2U1ZUM3_9MICO|nr:hypothetical protein C8046_08120 [Serinibacter arcticus]
MPSIVVHRVVLVMETEKDELLPGRSRSDRTTRSSPGTSIAISHRARGRSSPEGLGPRARRRRRLASQPVQRRIGERSRCGRVGQERGEVEQPLRLVRGQAVDERFEARRGVGPPSGDGGIGAGGGEDHRRHRVPVLDEPPDAGRGVGGVLAVDRAHAPTDDVDDGGGEDAAHA